MTGWQIDRQRGSARQFHALDPDKVDERSVWIFEVDAPALALGSSQPESDVDHDLAVRFGIDTFRRRSGGGAVLMGPGACVWIDIVLPVGDPLWTDDISLAPLWLGEVWASAFTGLGADEAAVHRGAMLRPPLAEVVCFAGLGPGEVSLDGKTVGISQRRTRAVTRFQTIALLDWDPDLHRKLLAPGIARLTGPTSASSTVGEDQLRVSPATNVGAADLVESFLRSLALRG
ncbi:MAG: hypothetical protein F2520_02300 [Actinobacteria bacterium]|uniref:Unannotated protein n=1 Tax=freshwater metagenome TaxID=449393 RepID=A0A6J5YDR2_9ZZZZ|nr:hypothetical protein [Actinomycetota bacterium]